MSTLSQQPCRKCRTLNPVGNQYCRKCGAVLEVSTTEVRAQPRPIKPTIKEIRWRWIALGALVVLGVVTLLLGIFITLTYLIMSSTFEQTKDLAAAAEHFGGVMAGGAMVFIAAFGIGGAATTWLSRQSSFVEPALSALIVVVLLTIIATSMVDGALWITGILVAPCIFMAGLGGRLAGRKVKS